MIGVLRRREEEEGVIHSRSREKKGKKARGKGRALAEELWRLLLSCK